MGMSEQVCHPQTLPLSQNVLELFPSRIVEIRQCGPFYVRLLLVGLMSV